MFRHAVVLCSGGLDSVVTAQLLRSECAQMTLLFFRYGQPAAKEEEVAVFNTALRVGADKVWSDLSGVFSLMGDTGAPRGGGDFFANNFVPNRNAVFLSIAFGLAASWGADAVAYGAMGQDKPPDSRPEFVVAFDAMEVSALPDAPKLVTPLLFNTNVEVMALAHQIGVQLDTVYSCHLAGGPCGACSKCLARKATEALYARSVAANGTCAI